MCHHSMVRILQEPQANIWVLLQIANLEEDPHQDKWDHQEVKEDIKEGQVVQDLEGQEVQVKEDLHQAMDMDTEVAVAWAWPEV